jgi:hypothetical protein
MKKTLLIALVSLAAFSSCTTAYKSGQTPDDVYYSPLPKQEEYSKREEDKNNRYTEEYYDDRYLRMKVRNRYQWNDLNDWYSYERWGFGHNYYWGSYYNPYNSWNYYYNPYSHCPNTMAYSNPKLVNATTQTAKPRVFNVGTYTNTTFNNSTVQNGKTGSRVASTRPVYNNTNTTSSSRTKTEGGLGRTIRNVLNSGNDNNRTYTGGSNNNGGSNNRTYTPSSGSSGNSSSSSSSGGSSGGSVSRPTRN